MNATAACVLGILQLGPAPGQGGRRDRGMTGWQVFEAAKVSVARFWNLTRSQVYAELLRLAEAGHVRAASGRGARESRAYRVTAGGEAAFRAWLETFALGEPRDEQLRSPLVLTVFFGEFLPREGLRRSLVEHRARHERRLRQLEAMTAALAARDRGRLPAAVLARGVAYQALVTRWLDDVLALEARPGERRRRAAPRRA